ncbi:hypothetical protein BJ912DRAFT_1064405 [Pholiota molesta]|nr:hypothetical protein BJ912DRAFT_1064405 [Pholiota molesta]
MAFSVSGEEMCFEKTWWDDLQNKICSALHFARRRPGTIPRTRIPSEAEPEPYENFAHQHEDVRVRVVDGVQFGELAEFCDLEFNVRVGKSHPRRYLVVGASNLLNVFYSFLTIALSTFCKGTTLRRQYTL